MMAAVGKILWALNNPTRAEVSDPKVICRKPIKAAALPACFPKGAKAKAPALGFTSPAQAKKENKKTTVPGRFNHPKAEKRTNTKPTKLWPNKAVFKISALACRFKSQMLS